MSAQTAQLLGTGIANVTWGIAGVAYTGICTRMSIERNGEEVFIYDGNGFTIGDILFDDKDEGSAEMIMQTTDTIPTRGTIVTFAGVATFIVKTIKKEWEWRNTAKWSFTCSNYVNLVTS
jgi:hypothetical protein